MDGWEQLLLLLHTQSSNLSALADFQLNLIFNPKHKIKSIKLSLSCFLNKFKVIFFSFYGRLISNQSKWRISLLRHHPQSLTAPPLELGRTSKHAPPPPISWQSDEIDRSSDSTSAPKFKKRPKSLFLPFYVGGGGSIFSIAAAKKNKNTLPDSGCLFHTLLPFFKTRAYLILDTPERHFPQQQHEKRKTTSTTTPTHTRKWKKLFSFQFFFFSFH